MTARYDDLEPDERAALSGLEDQLASLRVRQAADPAIEVLAGARPEPSEQELALDAVTSRRIWRRIEEGAAPALSTRRERSWRWGVAALAAAASIVIAIGITVNQPDDMPIQAPAPVATTPAAPVPAAPALTFTKPEVKLSPAALTWRGDSAENPFLRDLKPGLDAYRTDAYADAESHFASLAARYPRAIEAQFFLGAVRMMRNDFAGAVVPLTAAVALKEPTFQDDAMWYLAVAEQRSGYAAEAQQRLAALCNGSGARAADACQAQERLAPAPAPPRP